MYSNARIADRGKARNAVLRTLVIAFIFLCLPYMGKEASAASKADYTILVYMVGSDLESGDGAGAASADLEEMMRVGSTGKVNVIVETGGSAEWMNDQISNKTNQRWLVQKGGLKLLQSVGKRNMGDPNTLADFLQWSVRTYPASKYALIMWDHGAGSVHGFGADELFDNDALTLDEMQTGFAKAYRSTKSKFELIGFDACLMANLETAKVVQPYANYLVASEELEPGHGWNYTPVLAEVTKNGSVSGKRLGTVIADGYRQQAKSEGTEDTITLSVVDLAKLKPLLAAFDGLAGKMTPNIGNVEHIKWLSKARYKAEDYGSAGERGGSTDMTDLNDLSKQLAAQYPQQAAQIAAALKQAVVYNINSTAKPKASGLSIYFPSKDRDNFKENYAIYSRIDFSKNYKTFLASYIGKLLGDSNAVSFAEGKPEMLESDDGSETVYEVSIDPKEASSIRELYSVLGMFAEGSDSKVYILGIDNYDVELDSKQGIIRGYWSGAWVTLGGQFVSMFIADENERFTQYAIPVKLNGVEMDILASFNKETGESVIIGGWKGIDEQSGMADKDIVKIKPGDTIVPLYEYYDESTDEEGYEEGEPFKVGKTLELNYEELPQGDYLYGFHTIDYAENESFSDFTVITME